MSTLTLQIKNDLSAYSPKLKALIRSSFNLQEDEWDEIIFMSFYCSAYLEHTNKFMICFASKEPPESIKSSIYGTVWIIIEKLDSYCMQKSINDYLESQSVYFSSTKTQKNFTSYLQSRTDLAKRIT